MDSKIALQNQGIPIYKKDPIKQLNEGKELVIAPKQEDILQKGKEIEDKELRALYFFLYQTGARISSCLGAITNSLPSFNCLIGSFLYIGMP